MNLSDQISSLQSSAERQLHALSSAKKTENALVLPFFEVLGYDPFNVREVEPDFEVGREGNGMKTVDYAVKKEGAPIMLFQCAEAKTNLEVFEDHFLFNLFDEVEAEVMAFTNGLSYQFFVNLPGEVGGPTQPYLEFNLLDYSVSQLEALQRLSKPVFDADSIRTAAHERQSGRLLRGYLAQQLEAPDDNFVRFLAAQIYDGKVPDDLLTKFRPVVQKVLDELIEVEDEDIPTPERSATDASAPASEEDIELTPSDEESLTAEDADSDGEGGPFEKDLAKRVIDDF